MLRLQQDRLRGVLPSVHRRLVPANIRAAEVDVLQRAQIEGWVEVSRGGPPVKISLFLNEIEAASTFAKPAETTPITVGDVARVLRRREAASEVRLFRFTLSHF